jgi:hypothetical protein
MKSDFFRPFPGPGIDLGLEKNNAILRTIIRPIYWACGENKIQSIPHIVVYTIQCDLAAFLISKLSIDHVVDKDVWSIEAAKAMGQELLKPFSGYLVMSKYRVHLIMQAPVAEIN